MPTTLIAGACRFLLSAISVPAPQWMKVVKIPRVWGWRWGEQPDGIDPQSQIGFKVEEGILMAHVVS